MLTGLYSAANGMEAASVRHELAAANLAFAQNPGHRRIAIRHQSFHSAYSAAGQDELDPDGPSQPLNPTIDFRQGHIEHTGRTLDVALQGDGFFVLDGAQGPLYTRNGRFQVNSAGELVSGDGLRVRGMAGPLVLPPGTSSLSLQVTAEGRLLVGEVAVGQLEIVQFDDMSELQRAGAALFSAPDSASTSRSKASVLQGAYEHSNVEPVTELVSLLIAARQYEAAQQSLKSIERAVEKHTNIR